MRSRFIAEIELHMQLSLNNLANWSNSSGFLFSPQKCQAIHFCRKTKAHNDPNLSISNHPLTFVNNIKLLGLHLDSKLKFKMYLVLLKSDCLKRLNLMKIFSNIKWGADYKTLLQLYRGFIRSKLDYASIVYSSASSSLLNTLNTVHNQGIRLALGAFKSSPVTSMLSEAGEPPLSYRRKILLVNYLLRTQRDSRHLHYSLLQNNAFFPLYLDDFNLNLSTLDIISSPQLPAPWILQPPPINYGLRRFDKNKDCHESIRDGFRELVSNYPENTTHIYTDASKNETTVTAAFWSADTEFSVKLNPAMSICNAELMAILYATYFIISQAQNCIFLLCTDSLSALQSLSDIYSPNPISTEIRKLLHESKNRITLCFLWVPSHIGIHGNEEADRLARETLSRNSPIIDKIPIQDFKHVLKNKILHAWHEEWKNSPNNKLRMIKEENKPWHPPFSMSRREQVSLTRLRIGHTNLTHCFLMKKETPPQCDICLSPLTVYHLLKCCTKYRSLRSPNDLYSCLSGDPSSVLMFLEKSKLKL
ncbi:hypothetical protein WDU94_003614 [Cyamophila willieti]